MLAAAAKVGRRNGLPEDWLNEKAALFLPETADERAATMFNSPGLVVTGASAEHLLAMKMLAGRDARPPGRADPQHVSEVGDVVHVGHSVAEAEAAINRYEQKAAASRR